MRGGGEGGIRAGRYERRNRQRGIVALGREGRTRVGGGGKEGWHLKGGERWKEGRRGGSFCDLRKKREGEKRLIKKRGKRRPMSRSNLQHKQTIKTNHKTVIRRRHEWGIASNHCWWNRLTHLAADQTWLTNAGNVTVATVQPSRKSQSFWKCTGDKTFLNISPDDGGDWLETVQSLKEGR